MENVVVSLRDLEKAKATRAYARLLTKSQAEADDLIARLFEKGAK